MIFTINKCERNEEDINDNDNNKDRNNKKRNKKSMNTPQNPRKRNLDEIFEIIICDFNSNQGGNGGNRDGPLNKKRKMSQEEECGNPLCNHKFDEKYDKNVEETLRTIEDFINVGNKYHCKNFKTYKGLDLKIMNDLVPPLIKLNNLVGMSSVKDNVINHLLFFLQGLHENMKCNDCRECSLDLECNNIIPKDMMHTVITGPPGVGKTELGKILGELYCAMGILENGKVNIARRSDLIGKYLGHTAAKTQSFIDSCHGGVMFIDEAYSLGNPEGKDSFSKECLDTINQNLTENRNFLCVIAGYEKELETCFFSYNKGLKRRFSYRYNINKYESKELADIFLLKIKQSDWSFDETKIADLYNFFKKNLKYFPHFGGDVETLLLNCKISHSKRIIFKETEIKKRLTIDDVKTAFDTYLENRGENESKVTDMYSRMYL